MSASPSPTPGIGHNTDVAFKLDAASSVDAASAPDASSTSVAKEQLQSFIDRIERLNEEKAGIGSDIKDVFAEAKGTGFDTKALRRIIALRRMDAAERQEGEAILELYMQAIGMA